MKISILTTIYNDISTVDIFLRSLASQEIPVDCEVEFLVCNDGSSDGTETVLREAKKYFDRILYSLIENPINKGFAFSVNRLYELSAGEIIVFIDADAIPSSNYWLQNLLQPLIENRYGIVQGNFWKQYVSSGFIAHQHEKWRKAAFLSRFGNADGTLKTLNTRNLALRRGIAEKAVETSGYLLNPHAVCGADTELGFVIHKLNYKIFLCQEAEVGHADPILFFPLIKQKIHHGYNDGLIGISYPQSYYHAMWKPFVTEGVSFLFSIPVACSFAIANKIGRMFSCFKVKN